MGRVPAHAAALVMKAAPGAELACRAHNYELPIGDHAQPRGIVSYYAAAALVDATTLGDWLAHIETLVQQDVQSGRLPIFYRPDLRVFGDSGQPTPGKVVGCQPEGRPGIR